MIYVPEKKDRIGPGGYAPLTDCPSCGGDVDAYHRDYPGEDTMTLYMRCLSCSAEYREYWAFEKWERAGERKR